MLTAEQYLNPDIIRQVRRLDLRAKFIVEGFLAGLHESPYRGFSLEFAEHRRYTPGDDPRNLDWTVWAKTDRLFVRTYQAETSLAAYLVVDTSRSMAYAGPDGAPSGHGTPAVPGMSKREYATALASALGYLLVHQGDSVGLGLVGNGLNRFLRPRGGRRQLARVLAELTRSESAGGTDLAAGLHTLAQRVRRKSLMILLSDLVDEPGQVLAAVRHLAVRGHDVVVFQILDAAERNLDFSGPVILEDPETGQRVETDADGIRDAYRERLGKTVAAYERGVRELGGDFASMTTATAFDKALCTFLHERKRRF
jgi:uncharacterized protein (DUF58 family)